VRFAFEKDANQVPKGFEVLDQKDADGEIFHGVGAQLRNYLYNVIYTMYT
jgi:hypothetical protein